MYDPKCGMECDDCDLRIAFEEFGVAIGGKTPCSRYTEILRRGLEIRCWMPSGFLDVYNERSE